MESNELDEMCPLCLDFEVQVMENEGGMFYANEPARSSEDDQ